MAEFIEFKEKPKRHIKSLLGNKKIRKILLIFLIVVILGLFILTLITRNNKQKVTPTYKNVKAALLTNMPSKLAGDYEKYDKLLDDYNAGKYQYVKEQTKQSIDNDLSYELINSYYYLLINSCIRLNDLKSAKEIVDQYKLTNNYKNLDQEAKRIFSETTEKEVMNTNLSQQGS